MRAVALLLALGLAGQAAEAAKELNNKNFDEEVFGKGKFVFVKFLAPWCGHCKKLKPDWDKLGDHFNTADSKALVADVDCTLDDAKDLCSKYGVSGYPTLKTFGPDSDKEGDPYDGARDYNALKKFIKANSKPPCNIETQENCGKKELKYLEEIKEWAPEKLKEEKETLEKSVNEATTAHKEANDEFEALKDKAMAAHKKMEDAKKAMEKAKKASKGKLKILDQKVPAEKKDEL